MDTPVKLVLAGGSSHSNSYVKRLRAQQSDRIRILEWVSGGALDGLLTNAMLFVLPSDLEGMRWPCWMPWVRVFGVSRQRYSENRENYLWTVPALHFRIATGPTWNECYGCWFPSQTSGSCRSQGQRKSLVPLSMGKVAREVESQYLALTGRDTVKKPATSVQTADYRHRAA